MTRDTTSDPPVLLRDHEPNRCRSRVPSYLVVRTRDDPTVHTSPTRTPTPPDPVSAGVGGLRGTTPVTVRDRGLMSFRRRHERRLSYHQCDRFHLPGRVALDRLLKPHCLMGCEFKKALPLACVGLLMCPLPVRPVTPPPPVRLRLPLRDVLVPCDSRNGSPTLPPTPGHGTPTSCSAGGSATSHRPWITSNRRRSTR